MSLRGENWETVISTVSSVKILILYRHKKQMEKELDFNALRAQVLEEIKAGKPLFGKDGSFAPLLENILSAALEG